MAPRWMKEAVLLQPATLEYMRDVVIDDSRARKTIGCVAFLSHKDVALRCLLSSSLPRWNESKFIYMVCGAWFVHRYRPLWETAQIIRYAVDQVELGRTGRNHGLLVPPESS